MASLDCFWCEAPLNDRGVCTSCASIFPILPDIVRLVTHGDQESTNRPAGKQPQHAHDPDNGDHPPTHPAS